jgi:hypothetical protein
MGYVIGGIACVLYAVFVYYVAIMKPPSIIKIVKLKFGRKMGDKAAVILCYVFASIVLAVGILLFIHPWS